MAKKWVKKELATSGSRRSFVGQMTESEITRNLSVLCVFGGGITSN
jgi:hypothetical protein